MREAIETKWKEMGEEHLQALEAWKLDWSTVNKLGYLENTGPRNQECQKNTDFNDEETESSSDSEDSDDGQ